MTVFTLFIKPVPPHLRIAPIVMTGRAALLNGTGMITVNPTIEVVVINPIVEDSWTQRANADFALRQQRQAESVQREALAPHYLKFSSRHPR